MKNVLKDQIRQVSHTSTNQESSATNNIDLKLHK